MGKLFMLATVSVTSLLILGMFGIQTGMQTIDSWVSQVLAVL